METTEQRAQRAQHFLPIVFTDLVGSKGAMHYLPAAWVRRVLREHSGLALRLAGGRHPERQLAFAPTNLGDGNLFILRDIDEALLLALRLARSWESRWRKLVAPRLRSSRNALHGGSLRLRIAVHYGEVIAEQFEQLQQGATYSSAINTAFVLQHLAPPGGVAVTEVAAALASNTLYRYRYLGRFDVLDRPPSANVPQEDRRAYYELLGLTRPSRKPEEPQTLLGFERRALAREWYFRGMLTADDRTRREAAAACFHRAVRYHPRLIPARVELAKQLGNLGRFDEAVEAARKALRVAPDDADIHYTLGGLLERTDKLEEALANTRRALELDPDFAMARYNAGVTYCRLGDEERGAEEFRRAAELNPSLPLPRYNLACLAVRHGDWEAALEHLERALELDPSLSRAVEADEDLAPLRSDPRFELLIGETTPGETEPGDDGST